MLDASNFGANSAIPTENSGGGSGPPQLVCGIMRIRVGELCPLGRSDIFSFGAVLYEMVTGLQALEGKSQHSLASAIVEKEPAAISITKPLAPRSLDHIIPPLSVKRPRRSRQHCRSFPWQNCRHFACCGPRRNGRPL
jgi:hypothetical protein